MLNSYIEERKRFRKYQYTRSISDALDRRAKTNGIQAFGMPTLVNTTSPKESNVVLTKNALPCKEKMIGNHTFGMPTAVNTTSPKESNVVLTKNALPCKEKMIGNHTFGKPTAVNASSPKESDMISTDNGANCIFRKYKHFLVVLASAKTSQDFLEWSGLVESKIRKLKGSLEYNSAINTIHINQSSFTTQDEEYKDKPHAAWFLGIDFKKSQNINIDLTSDINKFVEIVYVLSTRNKAYKDGMEVDCKYVKRKQLYHYLSQDVLDKYRGHSKEDSQTNHCSVKRKRETDIPVSPEELCLDVKKLKVLKDEISLDISTSLIS